MSQRYYHPYLLTGGVLSAGTDADGELIITAPDGGSLEVESSIADNAAGSVGVTFSSDSGSYLILTGVNSYTGPTTLNASVSLYLRGEQSLPDNADVVVNGGSLRLDFAGSDPVHMGTVLLRRTGDIERGTAGAPPIDADAYLLESGNIKAEVAGDGTMTKAGIGTVTLWEVSPDYMGPVVIEGGALNAYASMALGNGPADDDHAIIIRDGGVLISQTVTPFVGRKIILEGGTLEGTTPAESIEVRSPSTIGGRTTTVAGDILGAADLTLDCHYKGQYNSAGMTVTGSLNDFEGDLYVTGYRVDINGNNANYDGDVFVSAERLAPVAPAGSPIALGTGLVTVLPDGMLDIRSILEANVRLEGGSILFNSASGRLGGELTIADKARIYLGWNFAYDVRGRISGTLRIEDMAELKIMPQIPSIDVQNIAFGGRLLITGEVLVGGDARITAYDNSVTLYSTITADAPTAHLDIVGGTTFDWRASLHAPEDTELSITFDGVDVPVELTGSTAGVSGSGTVRNDLVIADLASVRPGESAAGLLTIDGDLTIGDNGRVAMELGGLVRGDEYDALDVTGQATLGGTLDVRTLDGFLPNVGDEFLIISADHIDGTFSLAIGLALAENLSLAVLYSTDRVILRASLPADFDLDGDVDGDDFLAWQLGFGTTYGAQKSDGDYDNDGDVDGDDFLGWQSEFRSGGDAASTAVPEPASAGLLMMAVAAAGVLWRRVEISRLLR